MRQLLLYLFIFNMGYIYAQEQIRIIKPIAKTEADSVKRNFKVCEPISEPYKKAIYTTLLYFPELEESKLKFKEKRLKTTMNAQPNVWSLIFKNRRKRTYVVRINNGERDSTIHTANISFNAQVGVFGHEFCHFVDYSERSFFGVLGRLFAYTSKKKKAAFEKEMDTNTIERGLGWQLYDWSDYTLNHSNANYKYKRLKEEIYLKPEDIKIILEKNSY
ncbi:hypothetical protein [Saccharicrinis aurantiacus]|uniref:hypothetical protein n=1 Tax=Saccharicrinis aurantiacus TaxID=1849719 RepID=UPI00094FF5FF|nr:hypothetical protein [Saccharicrinis aurantiacus]